MIRNLRPIALSALAGVLALLPARVAAQIVDREPIWVVVSRDGAQMQCVDAEIYPIETLRAGDALKIDGAGEDWFRVIYPEDQPAFVPSDAVTVTSDGATATLTEPHQLFAVNRRDPVQNWRSVFSRSSPLPAGTELAVIEPIETNGGSLIGYHVIPPRPPVAAHEPHGYVPSNAVRPATAEEIRGFEQQFAEPQIGSASQTDPLPETPTEDPILTDDNTAETEQPQQIEPAETTPAPEAATETADTNTPAAQPERPVARPTQTAFDPNSVDRSLLDPIYSPDVLPRPEPAQESAQLEPPSLGDPAQPITGGGEESAEPEVARGELPILSPKQLEEQFDRVRALDASDTSAITELIQEYLRAITSLGNDPVVSALEQRVEFLKLLRDTRTGIARIDDLRERANERYGSIAADLEAIENAPAYEIVGRLVPSALYNGESLPLMYRVVTVGQGAGRTLGYVRPSEAGLLDSLVGRLVGIVGSTSYDESVPLRIIDPTRVDPLRSAEESGG
ncbi:MAG: hypothetical protein AAGI17_07260 [Planctomycetota bacterium]